MNYAKTNYNNRFVMRHSYNGKIRIKEAGKKEGKWIVVMSPDDLFKLGIEIDFKAFNFSTAVYNSPGLNCRPCKGMS